MSDQSGGKLLITGATGFIGGRLVQACLERGDAVRVLVRRPDLATDLAPAELVPGDLLQPDSLIGIGDGVDRVVHCASLLGKWGTAEQTIHSVNVEGTRNLINAVLGFRLRRFLHLSAGGVTGPVPTTEVDESYDCRPATDYERTKLVAEQEVLAQGREHGLPAAVVRPTFTYGPGDPHKLALFRAILRGRYAYISGGRSVNHPVFIEDLIRGLLLALDRADPGEVYIVGGDRPVTKRELVETIADALGCARPRLSLPAWVAWPAATLLEGCGRLFGFEPILTRSRVMMMADNFGYRIDKARQRLGYEPRVALQEGIQRTVEDYRDRGWIDVGRAS